MSALASESIAQEISAPKPVGLAPGYHVDANDCVVEPNQGAGPQMPAPDDPQVLENYQAYPGALADYRSTYAELQHDMRSAVALRRRELERSVDDENQKDAAIRLPLSVDLARLGRLADARHIWLDMLKRRTEFHDPALSEMQNRRYALGLQTLRIDGTAINPAFEDSGAGAHLQRGVHYANHGEFDRATVEWRLAVRCSSDFLWPHFLLGVVEQLRGRPVNARVEWLQTLENSEPQPPGPRSIGELKYAAMTLLSTP